MMGASAVKRGVFRWGVSPAGRKCKSAGASLPVWATNDDARREAGRKDEGKKEERYAPDIPDSRRHRAGGGAFAHRRYGPGLRGSGIHAGAGRPSGCGRAGVGQHHGTDGQHGAAHCRHPDGYRGRRGDGGRGRLRPEFCRLLRRPPQLRPAGQWKWSRKRRRLRPAPGRRQRRRRWRRLWRRRRWQCRHRGRRRRRQRQ